MNYMRVYNSIIEGAKERNIEGYVERHHIIPRFIRETDETIKLTAREHYICHWLLARHYDTPKAWYAFNCMQMVGKKQKRYITARGYQEAKEKVAKLRRKNLTLPSQKGKKSMYSPSEDRMIFISPDQIEEFKAKGFILGRKPHSKETKEKIANHKKGTTLSNETKAKMSAASKGKKKSEAHRLAIKAAAIREGRRPPSRKGIKWKKNK